MMMKKLLQLIRFLFIKQDVMEVYYIQGNDVLPKPLDKEEELAALIALENGDEEARNTLIEHNLRLVVYIAKRYETNPIFMEDLISIGSIGLIKADSSPWSPPTWMKRPKAYNYGRLVQTPENLKAYAKYFVRYVQAYAEHGITVNQLHVQNEVFADQKFPSALWDSEALKVFIRDYLGPAFDEAGIDTDIWLGTLNGPEDMAWTGGGYGMKLNNYNRFVDNILFDDDARKYIKGIAYQWAGQNCIARTHESWPEIELIQSESECGTGDNSWEYAEYIFHLINHYLRNGATAYTYWNMILDDQDSTWGWWQNSLFTITADKHEVRRNPEYYVMRHFSHYVKPGAKVLGTTGHFNSMAIAFRNPDGTVVVVVQNALDEERPFEFADPSSANRGFKVTLAPRSFNTFVLD